MWQAFAQVLPIDQTASGAWERLGVAGILVVAAAYLLRYFMGIVASKDARIDATTERFITMTREFGELVKESHAAFASTTQALRELKDIIAVLERRRDPH